MPWHRQRIIPLVLVPLIAKCGVTGDPAAATRERVAADSAYAAGMWSLAAEQYAAIVASHPREGQSWYRLGIALFRDRREREARRPLEEAVALGYAHDHALITLAAAHARSGDSALALRALEQLAATGFSRLGDIASNPDFTPLCGEARYERAVERVRRQGLPAATRPVWSPDGGRIASTVANLSGTSSVYVMSADGGDANMVVRDSIWNGMASWSPDGRKLVYSRGAHGNRKLHIVNVDGTADRQLTYGPGNHHYPSWSPDGRWIVYNSDQTGRRQIYRIAADGSSNDALTSAEGHSDYASWSATGDRIIFESDRTGTWSVYLMAPDGSAQRRIGRGSAPTLSPDGSRIAYHDATDGNFDVFVMASDGSAISSVAATPSWDRLPSWSPDGRSIAFNSARSGREEIYVMRGDGAEVRQLTRSAGQTP